MTPQMITEEQIMAALSHVMEPELHRDLVSLHMIRDLKIDGGAVSFTIMLTTPACPLRSKIEADARKAVLAIPGVKTVNLKLDSNVPGDGRDRQLQLGAKNLVAIASGKGGVGKTTIAVNVAVALAQSGAKVGLLDADIYGPNVPTMMGVHELPAMRDNKMVPAESYGVKMISIGFMVKPGQPLIWRGPMLHSAIRQFLGDVDWGDLDYLIIDLPPGTGDAQLSLAQSVPLSGGVIVTLPQQISLEDASRGLSMFRQLNVPVLGVVENMSYLELPDGTKLEVFGRGGGQQLAEAGQVPFLGQIPMETAVREGGDAGEPIVVSSPNTPAAKALCGLAQQIAARISVVAYEQGGGVEIKMVG
mgnify:CR=1 FL=1